MIVLGATALRRLPHRSLAHRLHLAPGAKRPPTAIRLLPVLEPSIHSQSPYENNRQGMMWQIFRDCLKCKGAAGNGVVSADDVRCFSDRYVSPAESSAIVLTGTPLQVEIERGIHLPSDIIESVRLYCRSCLGQHPTAFWFPESPCLTFR